MTPARQPQQEYIITDEELKDITRFLNNGWSDLYQAKVVWAVCIARTRPHTSAPAPENDLLKQIRKFHAAAHKEMCKDDADELHTTFWKGQWLAYNNVAGLVEHMEDSYTSAPAPAAISLKSCFGDFDDCPCDDECSVSEFCAFYCKKKSVNSCGMTESQCGMVQEHEKAEAANAATLECRKIVGDKVIFNKCPFDGDCGKCFLCDNAGGCIISSDEEIRNGYKEAAKAAREQAETTDNILAVLKKRYRKEMAIIDYIEMIECEVESLRAQQEPQQ